MVNKKNIKNKVKRAVRPPSNGVIMSIMALMLIVGAPALVSVIDDSYNSDIETDINNLSYLDEGASIVAFWDKDTPVEINKEISYLIDENINIVFNDPTSSDYIFCFRLINIDPNFLKNYSKMIVSTEGVRSVDMKIIDGVNLESTIRGFVPIKDIDDNIIGFEKEFTSYDNVLISNSSMKSLQLVFNLSDPKTSNYTFDVNVNSVKNINYAEIIIGSVGVILIICAILSTPWFGVDGIKVGKKRGGKR